MKSKHCSQTKRNKGKNKEKQNVDKESPCWGILHAMQFLGDLLGPRQLQAKHAGPFGAKTRTKAVFKNGALADLGTFGDW